MATDVFIPGVAELLAADAALALLLTQQRDDYAMLQLAQALEFIGVGPDHVVVLLILLHVQPADMHPAFDSVPLQPAFLGFSSCLSIRCYIIHHRWTNRNPG